MSLDIYFGFDGEPIDADEWSGCSTTTRAGWSPRTRPASSDFDRLDGMGLGPTRR